MKSFLLSIVAGVILLGVPAMSNATEYDFSGPCKSFSTTCIEIDMTKYVFNDTSDSLNNANLAYDDSTKQFWGEIDMPNSTIYFKPHNPNTLTTGNLVTYSGTKGNKVTANCDVWIEEYGSEFVHGYPGSAEVEIAISSTGKAAVKFNIICSDTYYTDVLDFYYYGWDYIYQYYETVQKVKLPTLKLQLN